MVVGDAHVFPGFLTPVLKQLFCPKLLTTFLTCFCRSDRRKYAGKKVRLNRGSNSQPPGHESDTLTPLSHPDWAGKKVNTARDIIGSFSHITSLDERKCVSHPFPNKPWFLHVCSTCLKTHWEKEKLLVTSNFSFSHSIFIEFELSSANSLGLEE